jgi:FMN hydrolase / 5-amino-6-(5-phospho-D-ribitylamino)uracil phosphatase
MVRGTAHILAAVNPGRRWVCLDVGETLIDETRIWATWAAVLRVPELTFFAALGATVADERDHRNVLEWFGGPDWRSLAPEVERRYGGFREEDLYPDARRTVERLRAAGYGVGVFANQPASRTAELRAIGLQPDAMAMSDELVVAKPDPRFFARALERIGHPAAEEVAYVGDRVDNDVRPARAAGMRAVWIRRGPWGVIGEDRDGDAHLVVQTLDDLIERIDQAWPPR